MLILRSSRMIAWHHAVVRYFLRQSPRRTAGYIVAYTAVKVFRLVAMLLPFKILSLARRNDVPAYAASFMTPESKPLWVVGLAVATVLLYLFTLVLDAWNRRTADIVARRAYVEEELEDDEDERGDDKEMADLVAYFTRICRAYGDLGFLAIVFTGASLINPVLFLSVAGALVLEAAALSAWLSVKSQGAADRDTRLTQFWQRWSSAASALNYFVGFAIMLVQFLWLGFSNALVAIVSILILRQILSAISQYVNHGLWLWRNKARLMSLIDTGRLNVRTPNPLVQFRDVFRRASHHEAVRDWLRAAGEGTFAHIRLSWADALHRGSALYWVSVDASGSSPSYLERIDFPQRSEHVMRERALRRHARNLPLPRLITQSDVAAFSCTLIALPPGCMATSKTFPAALPLLLRQLWAAQVRAAPWVVDGEPGAAWVRIERPDIAAIRWRLLRVAANDADQRQRITRADEAATAIQTLLDAIPLAIYNNALVGKNAYIPADGSDPILLDWTDWHLAPIGTGLHLLPNAEAFAQQWIESVGDAAVGLRAEHLLLAAWCERLRRDIHALQYAAALERLRQILTWYDRLTAA